MGEIWPKKKSAGRRSIIEVSVPVVRKPAAAVAELVLTLRAHDDAHALQVARRRRRVATVASLMDLRGNQTMMSA